MAEVLDLVITRRLESPNKMRGFHWRKRHRDTMYWEALIRVAAANPQLLQSWNLILETQTRKGRTGRYYIQEHRKKERRRVTVTRYVKSKRAFIRDEENLHFCVKPLNDALKRLGLIFDDSRNWIEQPMPEQRVAPDGIERTVVRIERLADERTHAAAI